MPVFLMVAAPEASLFLLLRICSSSLINHMDDSPDVGLCSKRDEVRTVDREVSQVTPSWRAVAPRAREAILWHTEMKKRKLQPEENIFSPKKWWEKIIKNSKQLNSALVINTERVPMFVLPVIYYTEHPHSHFLGRDVFSLLACLSLETISWVWLPTGLVGNQSEF